MTNSFFALFPGQGSQKVGMGKRLFDSNPEARGLFAEADEVLGFSLSKLCFEGPEDELTKTAIAQPAILTVSTAAYRQWQSHNPGKSPSVAAGHSLGEYSALVAAGSMSFRDAVLLVHKRGTFMQEAVAAGVGGMTAVLGREPAEIQSVLDLVTEGVAEMANLNAPGQIVVSGHLTALSQFASLMTEKFGKSKLIPLPVSAPFHSSLMKPAAEKLKLELSKISISKPLFPVLSNVTTTETSDPDTIRSLLVDQVCGKVRWVESVEAAISQYSPANSIEFGEGQVLSGLVKKIAPNLERSFYPSWE